jgi:hydrogenase maturation factor HypF (carbamoyltransferase family)
MTLVDFNAYKYVHNEQIPVYKLQKQHYWFDMNNPVATYNGKFNIEYFVKDKSDVYISNYYGSLTNFKLFDVYNDNLMDVLQMYPTHQHLQINDTARKVVGRPGVALG